MSTACGRRARPAELARDADTVAAIAGNLVGAYHGARRLPASMTRLVPHSTVKVIEELSGTTR
jgi:ADP-ribosylglycohydrolase